MNLKATLVLLQTYPVGACCTTLPSTTQPSTALHSTALPSTALHYPALHSTALPRTALHSTALHSTHEALASLSQLTLECSSDLSFLWLLPPSHGFTD